MKRIILIILFYPLLAFCQTALEIPEGDLIEGFNNADDWTLNGAGSYKYSDINNFTEERSSLTLGTNSPEYVPYIYKKISVNFKDYQTFSIDLYLPDVPVKTRSIRLELSSANLEKTCLRCEITLGNMIYKGWTRLTFAKSDFINKCGYEDWSFTMKELRISEWITGDTSSLTFDNFRAYKKKSTSVAIITFDDGFMAQKTIAKPILDSLGFKASYFIIGVNINSKSPSYMRWPDVDLLYNEGHDICNHTYSHSYLSTMNDSELDRQINSMRDTLIKHGYFRSCDFFSYPYGNLDTRVIAKIREHHKLARTSNNWQYLTHPVGLSDDYYLLREHNEQSSIEVHRNDIDKAIKRGQLLVYLFHDITPYAGKFSAIMHYLKAKQDSGLINVMTISQYWESLQKATKVELSQKTILSKFDLSQNYPNPFNPSTMIDYELQNDGFVSIKVYNVLGQEVRTLFKGYQNAGKYHSEFNASGLSSGIYLYKLESGNNVLTKKMILLQ